MNLHDELQQLYFYSADDREEAGKIAKRHDAELAELRRVAGILKRACKTAIYQLKGREHDGFLHDAIAAAEAAGVK